MAELFINWDDGNRENINITGTPVQIYHTYADNLGYTIDISGRTIDISGMTLSGSNITEISGFTHSRINVSSLNLNDNGLVVLPEFNNKLKHLYLNNSISGITSSVPDYSATMLETLHVNNNNIDTYTTSILPDTMHNFSADDNLLTTIDVTNIIDDMYNNSSSKTGMNISLINNEILLDTTNKYDLIDNGASVKTMGRFQVEIKRSSERESGHTFTIQMTKPVTNKNTKCHIDDGDGVTHDIILSGASYYGNYNFINKIYSSGSSSETYYPTIEGFLDDITTLTIQRTHNNGATINLNEFPNLKSVNLPYQESDYYYGYQSWYYTGYWAGDLDLSRNNKMESLIVQNHWFNSLTWPNDVSNFTYINTYYNSSMYVDSPRIDLMPNLTTLNMNYNNMVGDLYDPNPNMKLSTYNVGNNYNLNYGAIPDFTNNTGLTYINLQNSNRDSNGDTDWDTLTNLYNLILSGNYSLTGTAPDLTNVDSLSYLSISSTGYQSIGTNFDVLTGLTSIDMTYCSDLVETMPKLTDSTELNQLNAYNSGFYGQCIDTTIFPNLQGLLIHSNKLSKEFPDLSNNTMLYDLRLSNNKYNHWNTIYDIKIQNDGKILVGGQFSSYSGQTSNKIIRLNNDGSIHKLFDEYDKFDNYEEYYEVQKIGIQTDGKILAVGTFTMFSGVTQNRIIRFNSDGTKDNTFVIGSGFDGSVYTTYYHSNSDTILVGGQFYNYNDEYHQFLIALDSEGTISEDFYLGDGVNNPIYSITGQTDGKILIGGLFSSYDGYNASCLVRLNTGGTFDDTFDIGDGFNSNVRTIAIQIDGKILAGGQFNQFNGENSNYIVRLDSGGTIDNTFDIGDGFNNMVNAIALQNDGKILVGGQFSSYSGVSCNYLIRLNTNGTIDNSFDITNGFENNYVGGNSRYVNTIAIQSDGKILVGGEFYSYSGMTADKIIRLNADGSIDNTFVIGSNRTLLDLSNNTNLGYVELSYCGVNTYFDDFEGLSQVYSLYLSDNHFIRFPNFSNLTSLQELSLYNNSIIDDLSETCSLAFPGNILYYLELSYNKITGSIPTCWSGLTSLQTIYLGYNNITGTIPSFLSNLYISTFDVPYNQLSGDITPLVNPDWPYMNQINISNNLFTSGITSLSAETSLSYLIANNNNFSGSTFFDISGFYSLYELNISYCNLHGTMSELPTYGYMHSVNISNNYFTGSIPSIPSNSYNYNLYSYYASNNYFTDYTSMTSGAIPYQTNTINFSYNYLTAEAINKVLADVVTTSRSNGYLYLNGPNMGAPTGQGLIDAQTLVSNGWSVTTSLPPSTMQFDTDMVGTFTFILIGNNDVYIDWGDGGGTETVPLNNQGQVQVNHSYSSSNHLITITNAGYITQVDATEQDIVGVSFDENCISLQYLYLGDNMLTGFTGTTGMNNMNTLFMSGNSITDVYLPEGFNTSTLNIEYNSLTTIDIPASATNLWQVYLSHNSITGFTAKPEWTVLHYLYLNNNNISSETDINNTLISLDNNLTSQTWGTITLQGGNNAPPTGDGLTAKSNLISRGWTITTTFPEATLVVVNSHPGTTNYQMTGDGVINIDWGDGVTGTSTLTQDWQSHNHTYSSTGHTVTITHAQVISTFYVASQYITDIELDSNMKSLSQLYLNNNLLKTIDVVSGLTSLSYLGLSSNQLTGLTIASDLTYLNNISLSGNQLSGFTFDTGWTGLYQLYIENNYLDSIYVPTSLTNFRYLALTTNLFTGFTDFEDLTQLYSLVLQDNDITGTIPTWLSNFTELRQINFSYNQISGSIPDIFGQMPYLGTFVLSNTNITSGLTYLSGLTGLTTLDVNSNNFSGTTIFNLSDFSSLTNVSFSNCNLNGEVFLNNSTSYVNRVDFSYNNFVGNIPALNGNESSNYYIYFNDNYFTGYTSMVGSSNNLTAGYFQNNYLSTSEVNKLIADVAKTTYSYGVLNISGPNMGAPSGQGLTDISYLQNTMGWSVTYNT